MYLPLKVATACFLRCGSQTLFIDYTALGSHHLHTGKFAPPGGKLKEHEKRSTGAAREVLEETGIVADEFGLVYRANIVFRNEQRTLNGVPMKYDWDVYFYDCSKFDDSHAQAKEGALAWIENTAVPRLPLHAGDYQIWEWLNSYAYFTGEIVHVGERLTQANLHSWTPLN